MVMEDGAAGAESNVLESFTDLVGDLTFALHLCQEFLQPECFEIAGKR